ncbi:hypothetical protein HY407_02815 [Candidatus Gottesmanbacteria bacterium]|nr:hypothetical protein [Candidatus Gottesmanbacteria bacterium]
MPRFLSVSAILIVILLLIVLGLLSSSIYEGWIKPVVCEGATSVFEVRSPSLVDITMYNYINLKVVNKMDDKRVVYYRNGGFLGSPTSRGEIEPGKGAFIPCGRGRIVSIYGN